MGKIMQWSSIQFRQLKIQPSAPLSNWKQFTTWIEYGFVLNAIEYKKDQTENCVSMEKKIRNLNSIFTY